MQRQLGESAEFVENFRKEAQAAAKLNHPNIAQIYSFGQEEGQPYIVMELVSGKHFDTMVDEESPLDQALVLKIGADIADGLRDAADIGLTHGDIKPENILLDEKMQAKLVDFGIASFANSQSGDDIWGTPYYIAPERVKKRRADARSDIYSLGATLYHALTGIPPFDGETPTDVVKARFEAQPPTPSSVREDLNPIIDPIIMRMLEEKPSRRYPTYQSLLADLNRVLGELGPVRAGGRSGRVMIRPKRAAAARSNGNGVAAKRSGGGIKISRGSTGAAPMPFTGTLPASAPRQSTAAKGGGGGSRAGLVVGIVLAVLLVIAGGGVWGFFAIRSGLAKAKDAVLLAALHVAQDGVGQASDEVLKACSPIREIVASATRAYVESTNLYFEVQGELPALPVAVTAVEGSSNAVEAVVAVPEVAGPGGRIDAAHLEVYRGVRSVYEAESRLSLITQRVAEATSVLRAATNVTSLVEALPVLAELAAEGGDLVLTAHNGLRDAQAGLVELRSVSLLVVSERDAAERRRLAEEKRAKAEAETRRRKAAAAALLAEDLAWVEREISSRTKMFARNRYKHIARELGYLDEELKTEEGKAELARAVDRYTRLAWLRGRITESLEEKPFKKGWRSLDVVKGEELFLHLSDGRKIPWDKVDAAHLVPLIKHVTSDVSLDRKERCERLVAAAVYCHEAARENPKAMKLARRFAEQAVEVRPSQKIPIEMLIPGVFGEQE